MRIRLTFEVQLHSDYHISAGQRAGTEVDSALLRDYDQTPVLRGTTLAGLLRDGLSDLQSLIDRQDINSHYPIDEDAFRRLFGEPKRRKRWAFSSARPVNGMAGDGRWGSQDVARVRINPRTRRADPQKLFFQEEGDARLKFRFTATCPVNTAENQRDAALLIAASRMVRHLGAARRRGRGRCSIHLVAAEGLADAPNGQGWTTKAGLELFKKVWLEGSRDLTVEADTAVLPAKPLSLSGTYKRFRLVAQLLEPVLVAQRLQAANTIETLDVIPGTAVLGALATQSAYKLGMQDSTNPPQEFIQLFLRGAVQVSHLLPAKVIGQYPAEKLAPAVPPPQNLFQCENYPTYTEDASPTKHPVHNTLTGNLPISCEELIGKSKCDGKLKEVSGFILMQNGYQETYKPPRREEMHIRLDRETGRVEEGVLYEYISLEAGQWYVGELLCDSDAWERLQALSGLAANRRQTIRLGKAIQRGYGLIHFVLEELNDDSPTFILSSFDKRVQAKGKQVDVTMLLLTDTIVTDTWGGFYRGFDRNWLAEVLSTESLQIPPEAVEIVNGKQFTGSRHVDAFHTYRRMPRWRDEAIEAGSVVTLHITLSNEQDITALLTRLKELEIEGVGMRAHEGFGRVAFNHPVFSKKPAYESIKLGAYDKLLHPETTKRHHLQVVTAFSEKWQEKLGEFKWTQLKSDCMPIARLLFLYRYRPADELKQWLAQDGKGQPQMLLQPGNLWGGDTKQLGDSDKEPRLGKTEMGFLNDCVQALEVVIGEFEQGTDSPADLWAAGLKLLAERMADETAKSPA